MTWRAISNGPCKTDIFDFLVDIKMMRDDSKDVASAAALAPSHGNFRLGDTVRIVAGRCRLSPGCPRADHALFQHLQLKYDELLSKSAFNLHLGAAICRGWRRARSSTAPRGQGLAGNALL
jgi:hypothetical protein